MIITAAGKIRTFRTCDQHHKKHAWFRLDFCRGMR